LIRRAESDRVCRDRQCLSAGQHSQKNRQILMHARPSSRGQSRQQHGGALHGSCLKNAEAKEDIFSLKNNEMLINYKINIDHLKKNEWIM